MTGKKRMNRGNSVNDNEKREKSVKTMPKAYPQAHLHPTLTFPDPILQPTSKPPFLISTSF